MVNLFIKSKQFKYVTMFSSMIKLYSFRRHTFIGYFNLFIRFYLSYLNRVYLTLQETRLFNLINLVSFSKNTYFNVLHSEFSNTDYSTFIDYYFNTSSSTISSSIVNFTLKFNPKNIFGLLVSCFYNVFLVFFLFNFISPKLVSLPNISKFFTILRSPHTDKKSREQFNLVMSSRVFIDSIGIHSIFLQLLKSLCLSSLFIRVTNKYSYLY